MIFIVSLNNNFPLFSPCEYNSIEAGDYMRKIKKIFFLGTLLSLTLLSLSGCFISKGPSSSSTKTTFYKVDFYCDDDIVNGEYVKPGEICTPLGDVIKDYYTFDGWYTDKTFTTPFDFSKPINNNVNVYAKMNENAIRTAEDLMALEGSTLSWKIKNDIDLSSIEEWTPIQNFKGTLNGDGHTISGLRIRQHHNFVGLFGLLKGCVLNLKLNVDIEISGEDDSYDMDKYFGYGGLCGYCNDIQVLDNIRDITVKGRIYAPGRINVGGIVGRTPYRIRDCQNEATVAGKINVGGIVGYHQNQNGSSIDHQSGIFDCVNKGSISGDTGVGGIVGGMYCKKNKTDVLTQQVWRCINYGSVSANESAGGIIGEYNSAFKGSYVSIDVKECENKGAVTATGCAAAYIGRLRATSVDESWSTNTNLGTIVGNPRAILYNDANGNPHDE